MTDLQRDLERSRVNLQACAYNAAVNWGSERATKKMHDLLAAINENQRLEGAAKMDELVELGAIKVYAACPGECRVFPGGLRHADGCRNDFNSDFMREIRGWVYENLPQPRAVQFTSIGLVGGHYDFDRLLDDMRRVLERSTAT
jgi:hypothetical protein